MKLHPNQWRYDVQTSLVAFVVALLGVVATAYLVTRSTTGTLIDHEVIDLRDETNLNVSEIGSDLVDLGRATRRLANDLGRELAPRENRDRPAPRARAAEVGGGELRQFWEEAIKGPLTGFSDRPVLAGAVGVPAAGAQPVGLQDRPWLVGAVEWVALFPPVVKDREDEPVVLTLPATWTGRADAAGAAEAARAQAAEAHQRLAPALHHERTSPHEIAESSGFVRGADGACRVYVGRVVYNWSRNPGRVATDTPHGVVVVALNVTRYLDARSAHAPRHGFYLLGRDGYLYHPRRDAGTRPVAPAVAAGAARLAAERHPYGVLLPADVDRGGAMTDLGFALRYAKLVLPGRLPAAAVAPFNDGMDALAREEAAREGRPGEPVLRFGRAVADTDRVEVAHRTAEGLGRARARVDELLADAYGGAPPGEPWWRAWPQRAFGGRPKGTWHDEVEGTAFVGTLTTLRPRLGAPPPGGGEAEVRFAAVAARDEIAADAETATLPVTVLTVVVVSLVGAVAAWVMTWYVTRPLRKIETAAKVLAEEAKRVTDHPGSALQALQVPQLPASGPPEVMQLAAAFLKMSHQFRQMGDTLDRRVAVRTAELGAALDEVKALSRAKDLFLANVNHELRGPMTHIALAVQDILDGPPLPAEAREGLDVIRSAQKYLAALVNDFLSYTQIIENRLVLNPTEFDLAAFVREVAEEMRAKVEAAGSTLAVDCPDGLGVVRLDQLRLKQILYNLLGNAAKFARRTPVRVRAERRPGPHGGTVVVAVSDGGVGIGADLLAKLGAPYVLATNRRHNPEGIGLGLALSRTLAGYMGGDITPASDGPGKGSTFTLTLRARVDAGGPPTDPAPSDAPLSRPPRAGRKVLVVDDDAVALGMVKGHLERRGFEVATATSGGEALDRVKAEQPTAILLDILMPGGMNGWSVLAALKADPDTAGIPVIVISMVDDRTRGTRLGAADYVTKPVENWDDVARRIRRYQGASRRVLVVEDDAEVRRLCRDGLTRHGWEVVEAADGAAGLARLAEAAPAVVVLDFLMPVMDGFQFLAAVGENPAWRDIPVIGLTSRVLGADEVRRLDGRVREVIAVGGVEHDRLFDEIRTLVERHAAAGPA